MVTGPCPLPMQIPPSLKPGEGVSFVSCRAPRRLRSRTQRRVPRSVCCTQGRCCWSQVLPYMPVVSFPMQFGTESHLGCHVVPCVCQADLLIIPPVDMFVHENHRPRPRGCSWRAGQKCFLALASLLFLPKDKGREDTPGSGESPSECRVSPPWGSKTRSRAEPLYVGKAGFSSGHGSYCALRL